MRENNAETTLNDASTLCDSIQPEPEVEIELIVPASTSGLAIRGRVRGRGRGTDLIQSELRRSKRNINS